MTFDPTGRNQPQSSPSPFSAPASGQVAPQTVSLAAVVQSQVSLSAAAGWYPAPQGGGQQYWDGTAWTPYRAP